ncbi:hypothetical protein DRN75_00350 [Nanoarchaeota archaeon]|nr:MAG: hypothetical protein DRN75_00350 [Nanoarchaeota archaeon]
MKVFFPFERLRKTQGTLIDYVNNALESQTHLLVNAPTGIGKSAATISPAITYALRNNKTVMFLTSKHMQHKIALETIARIKDKFKVDIVAADFIGKKWMCLYPVEDMSTAEFIDFCLSLREREACEYYNNVRAADLREKALNLIKQLVKESPVPADRITETCREYKMCPYEINSVLASKSQFIVADYLHIFNPIIRHSLLTKIKKQLHDIILIIDEAHSLPARVRDSMSLKLSTFTIENAIKETKDPVVQDVLNAIHNAFIDLKSGKEKRIAKQDLIDAISKYTDMDIDVMIDELQTQAKLVRETKRRSFIGGVAKFLEAWATSEEGYGYTVKSEKNRVIVNLKCLDPSTVTKEVFESVHSAVLMSGTLTPLDMYKDILGLPRDTKMLDLPNPFPRENGLFLIVPETTTRYSKRGEEQYKAIAKKLETLMSKIPGNVAVFFPSYELRDEVYVHLECSKQVILEQQNMSSSEKSELFERLKSLSKEGACLLGVTSGNFSEGIDLPGELLVGVIIVGVPLERPDLNTQMLIEYYDKKFKKGWSYGYLYPAMNKALQAAGRCIRSETDRGVVVFLDERFVWRNYFKLLPKHWVTIVTKEPEKRIEEFFKPQSS